MTKQALFYVREGNFIRCRLCPHGCLIAEGCTGICRHRKNTGGYLEASCYAKISALTLDPIEKKPLYHFYPGSNILSVGSIWCNMRCAFCQNWEIAQQQAKTTVISPKTLCDMAIDQKSLGIAFTFNEPIIWYEYLYDVARLGKKMNLKIVLVTNGFIQLDPLLQLLPFVDALNIDVKGFKDEYYRNICGGRLEDVKKTVETSAMHCHVEITALIVGELNDDRQDMRNLAKWLGEIDRDIPLHISRYYPNYKMHIPTATVQTMFELQKLAKQFLRYVYIGNVHGVDNNTYCPQCGSMLVDREHKARISALVDGRCADCGTIILKSAFKTIG